MGSTYDLTELREMSGGDEQFVQDLLKTFLSNNTEYLEKVNAGLEAQDWKEVKFFAHKIKPSILLLKIDSLKQTILDLNEFAGEQKNLETIPQLVETLNNRMKGVIAEISDEINV